MENNTSKLSRLVVVGGGFGGLRVVKALNNFPLDITLVDRSNHHLFQPLLYQVATAGLSPADIAVPIRAVLGKQKNTHVVMAEVDGVDLDRQILKAGDLQIPYDYLVFCTGATDSYFGRNDWQKYAPPLKKISDALSIREKVLMSFEAAEIEPNPEIRQALLTFVVVGGGPTGVEMVGAIAELAYRALAKNFKVIDLKSTKIILLEANASILATFPKSLTVKAERKLKKFGADVRTSSRVEEINENGCRVNGQWIESRNIIWAAGVVASPVAKWLGVETDRSRRVKVLPDLSVPGRPNIFVVGDAAAVAGRDGNFLPGVAPVAMQGGYYVAKVIRARVNKTPPPPPFEYWNKGNLATVGRGFALADLGWLRLSGLIAWLAWLVVHIFYLIGFRNRVLVTMQWAWAYLTFQRGARLITGVRHTDNPKPEIIPGR